MTSRWSSLAFAVAASAALILAVDYSSRAAGGETQLQLAQAPGGAVGSTDAPGGADTVPGSKSETPPPEDEGIRQIVPEEAGAEPPNAGAEKPAPAAGTDKAEETESEQAEEAKPASDEQKEKAGAPEEAAPAAAAPAEAGEGEKVAEISEPTTPAEEKAFKVFDKHCARCHQVGKLNRQKPAKNFGNVLNLNQIAQDPNLILPGNPDGSRLFITLAKSEMPYDCFQEFTCPTEEPTKEEIQAIYDWIKGLGEVAIAGCADRKVIDEEAIVAAIAADLDAQQDHRRAGMRYITLSHLYNACAPESDMVRYRQGVVKLLNSLSTNSDVLRMRTIDPEKTIIAFHLDDLGWTTDDWNKIISTYPYGMKPDATVYETVTSVTQTPLAWVRGDWFAFTASRPPLYHDLLKLPATFAELEKRLNVDVKSNIEKFLVKRAGFQKSGVSKHNRLIERHTISTGYFWTSYDFKGDKPEQSLFVHPLGPGGENAFRHDGGETFFSLPNGFQGYYLNTAEGARLDKGPTEIVVDDSQLDRAVTNGISCMGCHNQGIRRATDDVRAHVLADKTFAKDVRTQVEALYVTPEEMNEIFDQDAERFRSAMLRAGLDPELDSAKVGVESINFLSKYYEKALDLRVAAAEYGLTAEEFANGLAAAGGTSAQLKRRLEQGVVPREILEAEFKNVITQVSDNEPIEITGEAVQVAKVGGKTKEETHDFDLALTSDRTSYKVDDLPVFTVRSKEDCHLTLINVDAKGDGTVIFPNKFQQDNFLPAGKEVQFPGDEAPFQFRLKDPGIETVIAICNATGKTADGIQHDFKTRGFTELGDYREFITRQIVFEGKEKTKLAKAEEDKGKAAAKSDILARAAIKLEVR